MITIDDVLKHKYCKVKVSKSYPDFQILSYKRKAFFEGAFDDILEQSRGMVIDSNNNIVVNPPEKIYNFGIEDRAPVISDDTQVTAYRKVNGFMAAISWHNDQLVVSTTGSLDSDFVKYIYEMMETHSSLNVWKSFADEGQAYTHFFECVHPDDPHVIPEKQGMWYLGCRKKIFAEKVHGFGAADEWQGYANNLGCYYPESEITTVGKIRDKARTAKHEGYVIYTEDDRVTKLKSPYYLTLKWCSRNISEKKLMGQSLMAQVDEEFYPLVSHLQTVSSMYLDMTEQERYEYIRQHYANKL